MTWRHPWFPKSGVELIGLDNLGTFGDWLIR